MLCLGSHLLESYCSTPLPTTSLVVQSSRKHVRGWTTSRSTSTFDNFVIVDKIIDVLAPLSDLDHTLHDELRGLCSHVYTFLSYGYAVHAREGVREGGKG